MKSVRYMGTWKKKEVGGHSNNERIIESNTCTILEFE
jgi:hypothetical protein